ncbi:MAG: VCBS repeat-containing protein [Myxococcales bacterium]|nr:VCBS repeat-containing protein [Myxococcales bacterium]
MRRLRYLPLPPLLVSLLVPVSASAAPWSEDKAFFTENLAAPSSKVDAADINGDKLIDVVFANGAGFDKGDANSDLAQQAFIQDAGVMVDVSGSVFGGATYNGRAVKIRDVDYDGDNDILLGTTWVQQSQLFLNDGGGNFTNTTDPNLPASKLSVGDVELGDVDYDGDLDIILANWGTDEGSVAQTAGGITALWSQMGGKVGDFGDPGTGMFEDVTLGQMPNVNVRWSWELEFVDVDNDWDLDIVVSAYAGDKASLFLFANDGAGAFTDASAGNLSQGRFALDVESIDLTGDGFMDLLTLHDGTSGRNRILVNDKNGKFTDSTDLLWPKLANGSSFDFSTSFYDYDSNKKVDWVIGAIQTAQIQYPDRLIYEKAGKYEQNTMAFQEMPASAGTYSIALADFNGDYKLDVAMAQSENAFAKKILIATEEVPVDTAGPIIPNYEKLPGLKYPGTEIIRVRAHDNKSPLMLHDFRNVDGEQDGRPYLESWADELPADPEMTPGDISPPGQWYGEYLWRIKFEVPDADVLYYRLCVIDAAKNKTCTKVEMTTIEGGSETESDTMSSMSVTDTDTDSSTDTAVTATDGTVSDSITDGTVSDSISASDTNTESNTLPTESNSNSDTDSASDSVPTESNSASNSNTETDSASNSQTASDSETLDSADQLDDDGCGCDADSSPSGALASLALLGLLGIRRRRKV